MKQSSDNFKLVQVKQLIKENKAIHCNFASQWLYYDSEDDL